MQDPVNSLCPSTISRAEWGARPPAVEPQPLAVSPVPYVVVHHGGTKEYCYDQAGMDLDFKPVRSRRDKILFEYEVVYEAPTDPEELFKMNVFYPTIDEIGNALNTCSAIVRSYQNYHIDTNGWNDIGYSFVIGEDGQVYEGRGWDFVGAHAPGYNTQSIGICVIGDFSDRLPNEEALATLSDLISCGVDIGKIGEGYQVIGHRQTRDTLCPGDTFYKWVKALPQWTDHPVPLTQSATY
uniref:Uncharacterized protein n=1 Tax=Timema poppense TaxID=170557 RepID=A0A7R9H576_TIMPO|nr:unnamed protein product [Timema poppensis]